MNGNISEKGKRTNQPRTKNLGDLAAETEPRPDTANINRTKTAPTEIAAVTNPSISTEHQNFLSKPRESESSQGTISTIEQWGTPKGGFSNPRPTDGIDGSTDKTNAVARASTLGALKQKPQQRQQTCITNLGHLWFGIPEPQNDWKAIFRTAMGEGRRQERPRETAEDAQRSSMTVDETVIRKKMEGRDRPELTIAKERIQNKTWKGIQATQIGCLERMTIRYLPDRPEEHVTRFETNASDKTMNKVHLVVKQRMKIIRKDCCINTPRAARSKNPTLNLERSIEGLEDRKIE
jgi:hypothetical protein